MSRPRHTIIYTHGAGRLGNQVIRFAHWIAWVRANRGSVEVLNFSFWPYAHYFAAWQESPGCVFPLRGGWPDRWARWRAALPGPLLRFAEERSRSFRVVQGLGGKIPGSQAIALDVPAGEILDLDEAAFLERVTARRVTTLSGWRIASWRLVAEQQDELRKLFRPAETFAEPARNFIRRVRAEHDLVIGVLIRQSDYRVWDDGRFFYSSARYAAWIREAVALHPGRRVAFVVASEEAQDPAVFAGLPVYFATGNPGAGGHWVQNWIELAECDVIMSPPSTFSATAAFLGDAPLWPLVALEQKLALDQVVPDGMIGAAHHPIFSRSVK